MSTSKETVAHIVDLLSPLGDVRALAMFGEYGVYCDHKLFALICSDTLFLKITKPTEDAPLDRVPPYQGASPYHQVTEDWLEDPDRLLALAAQVRDALPKPKKVPKRLLKP